MTKRQNGGNRQCKHIFHTVYHFGLDVADKTVLKADGTSLSYVECTVVDENGNMVPDADNLVKFAVSGKASIVGVDNGKQESAELINTIT